MRWGLLLLVATTLAEPTPPADRDRDRIPDDKDRCPTEPETYNGNDDEDGCPDQGRVRIFRHSRDLEERVLFARDSATLLPEFHWTVLRVADWLRSDPERPGVSVLAYTEAGEKPGVAAARARAVVEAIVAEGVERQRLVVHDLGKSQPVCAGRDEDCRLRNRRVEFRIIKSALESEPDGWVDIMPDRRLTGWARVEPISTSGLVSVVNPQQAVWVPDVSRGILDCQAHLPAAPDAGKPGSHEMLRYEKELGDFIFHVEWRFTDKSRSGWNAGIYARVNAAANVWHQAQVGAGAGGYWFGDTPDASGKIVRRKLDPTEQRVRPAGQWNTYEMTARGDRLTLWVNGATVSEMSGLRILRGYVGLEAERHRIEFRNLKIKELPPAR